MNKIDDALLDGAIVRPMTPEEEAQHLAAVAQTAGETDADDAKVNLFDRLMEVCETRFPFFVCDGIPYLSPGDSLAIALESKRAEQYIRHAFYQATGHAASTEMIGKLVSIKAAQLAIEGVSRPVFRRVGKVGDVHYLDLCREGKVVEMTAKGWRIVTNPDDVYFVRSGADDEALPTPEPGGDVMALAKIANVSESTLRLLIGWLVTSLRVGYPYVVMVLEGEAGSGKSTLARLLKYLVDPAAELLRTFPGSERDFAVSAHNTHVMTLDNVDRITAGQSDMLCRAATGGGFSARNHYSMTEETVISIRRPIVITGIHGLVERADMADRVALVQLDRVTDGERRTEEAVWQIAEAIRPQVLGGLLDAYCAGLATLPTVRLQRLPRMADFARFVTACEAGLPWETGSVLAHYTEARGTLTDQAIERDMIALAVLEMMTEREQYGRGEWEGTASELLSSLTAPAGIEDRWPRKASTMTIRLMQAAPLLRVKGLTIERRRSNSARTIVLRKLPANPSHPSHPSPRTEKPHKTSPLGVTGLHDVPVTLPVTTRHQDRIVTGVTDTVTGPGSNPSPEEPSTHEGLRSDRDGVTGVTGTMEHLGPSRPPRPNRFSQPPPGVEEIDLRELPL